ncbi:multiple C2 and transmembrane domain-containing protein [Amyelois transitella]|uniref:multiple C2 and transmembrane domain-containing protein n=1 Tax=Amyelois transitella TaxID=680683 RepID=UPI00067C5766|nr:multiple C2 and transmembrane domain-containing protein [Amyelois transitella]
MASEKYFNGAKTKHFAKLHERIQNKYNEMQKKLEKSKSVDSLTILSDDHLYQENLKYASTNDLSVKDVFNENESRNYPLMHSVIVEDINKREIIYTDINYEEVSVPEYELNVSEVHKSATSENNEYDHFSFNDWTVVSNESLNEPEKKWDESSCSPPPTPKISIRDKIGSRISAVREKRRESKEKNLKNKKKETPDTGIKVDKVEKLIFSSSTKSDLRLKDKRFKLGTVTIALIEVTGLDADTNEEKQRNLQCRFKLGLEKCKSKVIKNVVSSSAKWQEIFNLNIYDENSNLLELSLCDTERKDITIGKHTIDLLELQKEKTHAMKIPIDGSMPNAEIFLLLTITGSSYDDLLVDIDNYNETRNRAASERRNFVFYNLNDFNKVGRLSVIVYGAQGLAASDCYCSLKLINETRHTHTEYKTNDPNWMKLFTFDVSDITSVLEVFVKDERKDDNVGRVVIPLLNINNGAKVWYPLKDDTLRERAKGNNPKILLEMIISWNIVKASARVIKPKEIDFLETEMKFDRKLFFKHIARAKVVVLWTMNFLKQLKACFEWESRKWNSIGLIVWLLFIWFFSPWMVPLLFLIPFVWYRPPRYFIVNWKSYLIHGKSETEEVLDKEGRTTFRQKINNLQELIYTVQNFIGKLASFGERVKNLCNFTVPYLSLLSIFFLIAISTFVYIIPVRYILMGWAIKKYVRKIIKPDRVPHSEVMDLISRVPDDEDLNDHEILAMEATDKDRKEHIVQN